MTRTLLLLLAVLSVLISCNNVQDATPIPPTVDSQATETRIASIVIATLTTSTATPLPPVKPTNTKAPTLTATRVRIARIGERVVASGVALTVLRVIAGKPSVIVTPQPNTSFIALEVLIENLEHARVRYNALDFVIRDSEGFEHESESHDSQPELHAGTLGQGDKVRGNIAFQIPKSKSDLVLSYELNDELLGEPPLRVLLDGETIDALIKDTPTPIPTQVPTKTRTPNPTSTPETTDLALQELKYVQNAKSYAEDAATYLEALSRLFTDASNDPSLVLDTDWRNKTALVLAGLKLTAQNFKALKPPTARTRNIQQYLDQIADNLDNATTAFAQGIDNLDVDKINEGTQYLQNAQKLTEEANTEIKRLAGQ